MNVSKIGEDRYFNLANFVGGKSIPIQPLETEKYFQGEESTSEMISSLGGSLVGLHGETNIDTAPNISIF